MKLREKIIQTFNRIYRSSIENGNMSARLLGRVEDPGSIPLIEIFIFGAMTTKQNQVGEN